MVVFKDQDLNASAKTLRSGTKDAWKEPPLGPDAQDHQQQPAIQHIPTITRSPLGQRGVVEWVARGLIGLLGYLMLVSVFEFKYFVPYDGGFAVAVLWVVSVVCGHLATMLGMPQLLGMLLSGIALKNLGDPVRGLESEVGAAIRTFGLMNILMRGGLEMDLGAIRRVGTAVVRLTVLPGVSEAVSTAVMATFIFDMPFFLALAMGFILAAVSPAVVVGGMFDLQSKGYGVKQGIPSLVVAAASFDDVVAISGFSMFIGLASGTGDVVMEALHGPINIVSGVAFGFLGAFLLSLTEIWDTPRKRTGLLIALGTIFCFVAKKAHYAGAGALASLVMAAAASSFWGSGVGGRLSQGPNSHIAHEVEQDLSFVWRIVAQPLLFSVIGAALDFSQIEPGTIPKALGLITFGVIIRSFVALLSTYGAGLSLKERTFIALAWVPKATVQAALGSVPLDLIRTTMKRSDDPDKYDKSIQFGVDILTVSVFSILMTAPLGLVVIQYLGPRWLERDCVDVVEPIEDDEEPIKGNEKGSEVPPSDEDSVEAVVLGVTQESASQVQDIENLDYQEKEVRKEPFDNFGSTLQ